MSASKKYLDNLTDELYNTNFFSKMRKGVRKLGLIALIAATIGVGGYLGLGYARSEEAKPSYQNKIAFVSLRDGNFEIYVMNLDGSNPTRLTNNPASDTYPSWSPDEKRIAFTSNRDGNLEIYVMNADGSEQRNLTNADDNWPSWSPFLKTEK